MTKNWRVCEYCPHPFFVSGLQAYVFRIDFFPAFLHLLHWLQNGDFNSVILSDKRSENFFSDKPDTKYFRFCGPHMVSVTNFLFSLKM